MRGADASRSGSPEDVIGTLGVGKGGHCAITGKLNSKITKLNKIIFVFFIVVHTLAFLKRYLRTTRKKTTIVYSRREFFNDSVLAIFSEVLLIYSSAVP